MSTDVTTLDQLAPIEEKVAEMAADGFDQSRDGRFHWESFLRRVEIYLDIDLPNDMSDPVIRRVQRVARQASAEARA